MASTSSEQSAFLFSGSGKQQNNPFGTPPSRKTKLYSIVFRKSFRMSSAREQQKADPVSRRALSVSARRASSVSSPAVKERIVGFMDLPPYAGIVRILLFSPDDSDGSIAHFACFCHAVFVFLREGRQKQVNSGKRPGVMVSWKNT